MSTSDTKQVVVFEKNWNSTLADGTSPSILPLNSDDEVRGFLLWVILCSRDDAHNHVALNTCYDFDTLGSRIINFVMAKEGPMESDETMAQYVARVLNKKRKKSLAKMVSSSYSIIRILVPKSEYIVILNSVDESALFQETGRKGGHMPRQGFGFVFEYITADDSAVDLTSLNRA